jgi:hypothetical protein
MRLSTASLLVGCILLFSSLPSTRGHAQWTDAKIPGEKDRTAQGCAAESRSPGDWICILVRCDQPGAPPSLHFSTPGSDIKGNIKLVIDDTTFTVSVPDASKSPLPSSTRAEAAPGELLEAMKAGSAISIEGADLPAPYNRISLQNSRKAIERIEWSCARPHRSAASLWRRLTRGIFF